MAKKIKKSQIEGQIVSSISGAGVDNTDPTNPIIIAQNTVTGISITGTSTKTITITFSDATFIQGTFTDKDTTYTGLTDSELVTGTSTTNKLIAAKTLVDYINARLSATFKYKASVAFAQLPASGNVTGDVYNITDAFSLNGETYPAGTNVAWNGTGWDALAGFLDTSAFLTVETDPTGVANIAVSGGTTKTITVTLNNGTTKTAQFTDNDTTYAAGTLALLNDGTDQTNRVWKAKDLVDWINGKNFLTAFKLQKQELFTIGAGNISGSVVTISLTNAPFGGLDGVTVFLNGVKLPKAGISLNATNVEINNNNIPTPVEVGDEIDVVYLF